MPDGRIAYQRTKRRPASIQPGPTAGYAIRARSNIDNIIAELRMVADKSEKQVAPYLAIETHPRPVDRPWYREVLKTASVVVIILGSQKLWESAPTRSAGLRWMGLEPPQTINPAVIDWRSEPVTHYNSSSPTDLGWIPAGLPNHPQLNTANPWSAKRTAKGPYGSRRGKAHDFGDFGKEALEAFWDKWVSPILIASQASSRPSMLLATDPIGRTCISTTAHRIPHTSSSLSSTRCTAHLSRILPHAVRGHRAGPSIPVGLSVWLGYGGAAV